MLAKEGDGPLGGGMVGRAGGGLEPVPEPEPPPPPPLVELVEFGSETSMLLTG